MDLGSTWCKAAYLDCDGRIIAEGRAYNRGGPPFGLGADALARTWDACCQAVRAASDGVCRAGYPAAPEALALSCRGVIGIWLDAGGEPVGVPDGMTAAAPHAEIAAVYADPSWGSADPYAYGYVPSLVGRTRWLAREHPDRWRQVRRAGALHDWMLYRMTGQWVTDPATGPGQPVWPDAVMALTNLPVAALPAITDFAAVIGTLRPAAAADLGLPRTTRVVNGAHDGAAANLGAGAFAPGDACITLGTHFVLRVVTGEPTPGVFGYRVPPGLWAWVRGAHGLSAQLDAVVAALDGGGHPVAPQRHAVLTTLAADAPIGTSGVRLPVRPLGGEAAQAAAARDAIRAGHLPGAVYRAALEGTALALHRLLMDARGAGANPTRLVVTGGATGNGLLLRILSGALDTPLYISEGEAGLYGAAVLAAVGAGWFETVAASAACITPPLHSLAASQAETTAYAAFRVQCAEGG